MLTFQLESKYLFMASESIMRTNPYSYSGLNLREKFECNVTSPKGKNCKRNQHVSTVLCKESPKDTTDINTPNNIRTYLTKTLPVLSPPPCSIISSSMFWLLIGTATEDYSLGESWTFRLADGKWETFHFYAIIMPFWNS